MKKKIFSVALTCGLVTVIAALSAYAQMPGTALRASIPFDFNVRGKVLPAGEYEIRRITDEPGVLIISSLTDNHERAMFDTQPVETRQLSSQSQFVFHRYGESYFLSEIFAGGGQTGRELLRSRQERDLSREMASNRTGPEMVAVTAY
jgi:hypothetical protein